MALGAQVVNFIRLRFLHDSNEVAGVAQVAIVQLEVGVLNVRVLVDVVDTLGVEQRRTTLDAMNDVALLEQKFGKVRTVLAGDARDKGYFA